MCPGTRVQLVHVLPLHLSRLQIMFLLWVANHVTYEHDDLETERIKVAAFFISNVATTFGIVLGTLYLALGASVLAIFPYLYAGLCCIGIIHLFFTKNLTWVRSFLPYGLSVCALGIYLLRGWSFGAELTHTIAAWALLGPQLGVAFGYAFAMTVRRCPEI